MPRRSSVEKPAEDPNVEKRVTRGSVRKSEGGSSTPAVATPEKQKDANKSKTQSPAKASPTPGKRGRPSKRSIAAEEDNNKAEDVDQTETKTAVDTQDDTKDTNNHETQPAETQKDSEAAVVETESSGKKRLAKESDDKSEGPSAKKARSEDEPAKETEEADTKETTPASAVTETSSNQAEKMDTKEESATEKPETSVSDAPDATNTTETGDAVKQSNDGSGDIPDVCSKPIPSEPTAEVKAASTEEVIKENGCHEAENKLVASDAC